MWKRMKELKKDQRGLTLIELLAVVVILGIIMAIAIPAIGGIIEKQKAKAHKANALMILDAAQIYFTDNPSSTASVTVKALKDGGYLQAVPQDPFTNATYNDTNSKVEKDGNDLKITLPSAKTANDTSIGFEVYSGAKRDEVLSVPTTP